MTNEPVAANAAQPRFIAQKLRDGEEEKLEIRN